MLLPDDEIAQIRASVNQSVFFKWFGRSVMLAVVLIPIWELVYFLTR